jgi:hypothetical protein
MNEGLIQTISNTKTEFNFGDERLNSRATHIVDLMSKNGGKSLPQMFCREGDLRGAYRFFNNSRVSPKSILTPHKEETINRCKSQEVVLVVQDSSDLDFDYMNCLQGFSSLHVNIDKGYRIHPCLALTEGGTPLGILASFDYTRLPRVGKSSQHRNTVPIEDKESYRWLQGYREACRLKAKVPETQVISIADREADIYECFLEATNGQGIKADLLIRAQHNRALINEELNSNKLEKKLVRSHLIATATIKLYKHLKTERTATIAIRATTVNLQAPSTEKKKSLPSVQIHAVLVSEIDPPKGIQPLNWLLLTTLPIETQEEVFRIIKLYGQRWSVEVYFKVLKSGCRIDTVRFHSVSSIKRYIALTMLVAWKVMLATYLPREYPDAPFSILFTEIEWRLAYHRLYPNKPPPDRAPTLKEAVMLVAMLGGYQKRKEPPGIQTVWEGIKRLLDMVYGHKLAQEVFLNQKIQ